MAKKNANLKIVTSNNPVEQHPDKVGLERLIFFSDAVFAIAITLLTLDIRLDTTSTTLTNDELLRSILAIGSKYLAYIISFLVIGLIWIRHHRKFRLIQRYDATLMLINLFLLMTIAFIPFPTSLISTFMNWTATIFYAAVMILASIWSAVLWWYASHKNRLIDPHLDPRLRRRETIGPMLTIGVFLLSIGLSFVDAGLARISWILIVFAYRLNR